MWTVTAKGSRARGSGATEGVNMKIRTTSKAILFALIGSLWIGGSIPALGLSWLDFVHPGDPHDDAPFVDPYVAISVPELVQDDSDATTVRPVLFVLMEFSDVTHRQEHDLVFWEDLAFGDPRVGTRPSVAEIFRENANGRLQMVPALTGDAHDGSADGMVGWVASTFSASVLTDPSQKRAEGIRVADPLFDFAPYDDNGDGLITSDELVVVIVFADDSSCDQHHDEFGHPDPPACVGRPGGNNRPTDPRQVEVDNGAVSVHQHVAGVGEMTHVGVVAHEIAHGAFGLGDLYQIDQGACNPYVHTADGYTCSGVWYPPPPKEYSLMDSYWVDYVSHLDPWAKIHLGFVKPLVIDHDGTYSLYDAETERQFSTQQSFPEAAVICDPVRTPLYKDYFILENRNLTGLPDRGLAVWLIDENDTNLRRMIRLMRRADPWAIMNQALWDGTTATEGYDLTADSVPRNTDWADGSDSHIEITDISAAGPAMSFTVRLTPIFVDIANSGTETGSEQNPFNTVGEAVSAIPVGPRTLQIAHGQYPESVTISTPCTLTAAPNATATIGW
jgi:M6 family metalloprotease-like protein